MLKNKNVRIILIAILAALLSDGIVYACSPVEPRILIRCSNMEVSIGPDTGRMEGESYDDMQERWVKETMNHLLAIVPECEEDLVPILDSFDQEITVWLDYESKRGAFLDGDLILEPYSFEKEAELSREKDALLSCSYAEHKHIEEWLIVFETSRPYCYTFWYVAGMCPSIILSLGHFLFYLVTNFSFVALPYLAGLLIAGATIIYAWWKFLKNRQVMKLWGIVTLSIMVLIAELFMIVMPVWLFIQVIGWISFFGILVLWYKYFQSAKYASRQNTG